MTGTASSYHKDIFQALPIPVWEEDLSRVAEKLAALLRGGVVDMDLYLKDHPEMVREMAGLVRILAANPASLVLFGVPDQASLERVLRLYFVDAAWDSFREKLILLSRGGARFTGEIPIRFPGNGNAMARLRMEVTAGHENTLDRVVMAFIDSAAPMRDADGNIIGAAILNEDITERHRAEKALWESEQRSRDELEERVAERTAQLSLRARQLARLTSKLTLAEQKERRRLATVIHDNLQQILTGAGFRLDVLEGRLGPDLSGEVAKVRKLITESLSVSRSLTADLSPPILHEAGLVAGLEWLCRWVAERYGLTVRLTTECPDYEEREDVKILLFESTRELLLNVAKHAGVSEARIDIKWTQEDCMAITVSDGGKGFDPDTLRFETTPLAGGFGLFSIRERLDLIGGNMTIHSIPGNGARFILTAPARSAPAAASDYAETEGEANPFDNDASDDDAKAHDKFRVLLADDHSILRQGLAILISGEPDMEIVGEASNGKEAVELARQLLPAVILMDFSMPKMDGVTATRIIHSEMPNIRIIGLSMYEESDRAIAMREAGAVDYVSKSAASHKLLAAIRGE